MRALLTVTLLGATPAAAWPVDWVHDVEPGKERFVRLPSVDWFEVDDSSVAQAEWLADSNELLLSGLKAGRAVVLLGAQGKVAAWRVRVGGKPVTNDAARATAAKSCPDLKWAPLEDVKLTVTVTDDACRQALLTLFQTDAIEARALEVTLTAEVLQVQLKALQKAFETVAKGKVHAKYVGAGLVLTGTVTTAEHRKVLFEVLRHSLGRFVLDDGLEVIEPPAPVSVPARDGGRTK